MIEKKVATAEEKKVYKAPTPVNSVESGKIMLGTCPYSCGSSVRHSNSNCGK